MRPYVLWVVELSVAFYSFGAGLGHISRTLKVIHKLQFKECVIFTDNRFVADGSALVSDLKPGDVEFIVLKPGKCLQLGQLCDELQERAITRLFVDSFPVGLYGELNGLSNCMPSLRLSFVARALNWRAYKACVRESNNFDQCLVVEALSDDYRSYLKSCSSDMKPFSLRSIYPPTTRRSKGHLPRAYCAIMHSGPAEELMALLSYAESRLRIQKRDIPIVIFSPGTKASEFCGRLVVQRFSLEGVLPHAQILVSAAGFNTVNEMSGSDCEHWLVPFSRRYDDQYMRACANRGELALTC